MYVCNIDSKANRKGGDVMVRPLLAQSPGFEWLVHAVPVVSRVPGGLGARPRVGGGVRRHAMLWI